MRDAHPHEARSRRRLLKLVAGGTAASVLPWAAAQTALTAESISIGRLLPRSSAAFGEMARQRADGADACIAHVNATGGIGGRRLVINDRDDGYSAAQAAREIDQLIVTDKVFAVLGAFGTPTLPAVIQAVERAGVPLVGAASLSNEARLPPRKWVFPVRVSAATEARATVRHQVTLGARRFVVLSSKEAYGPSGAVAYVNALQQEGLAVQEVSFAASDDPRLVAGRLLEARAEVLLISVVPKMFGPVLRAYRAAGGAARILGLSVIRIEDLRAELGPLAVGIGLSQPVPTPASRTSPLANEYRQLLARYKPGTEPSYHGLEAFLEARVMVEGLRRAGASPTREQLVRALESFKPVDVGGVLVRYAEGDRTGSTFSELVMIGAQGTLIR
jgi:ABC-type branched-subunit amino acid transport system substrate-binding protein